MSSESTSRRGFIRRLAGVGGGLALAAGARDLVAGRAGVGVVQGSALARLRDALDGTLILPSDDGFEAARRVASFNPRTDKRPAVIARCATPDDVARSLEYARSAELPIAVRGGGHDVMGRSVCQGGVLIDLGSMNAIDVGPQSGRATAGAGIRAGAVDAALQPHGLAAVLGCNPAVGIAGLTLGGGLGWMLGRFGAACDNLVSATLVTADGRLLRAAAEENPELFWGLRGGGGNFGVVTAFEYRLHPVDRVVGGYLAYPARGSDFLRTWRDCMAAAPDALTVELILLASAIPPHDPVWVAVACWSGAPGAAERALAPLRRHGRPLVDTIRQTTYARLTDPAPEVARLFGSAPAEETAERPAAGGFNYWQGAGLSDWSDAALEAFVARAAAAPPGWSMGIGHYMHGEICRVADAATPVIRREHSASYYFNIGWGDPGGAESAMDWVDDSIARMRPFSDAATYVNYLSSESETAVAVAYGDNYRRLQALKRRFDPDNVFDHNRNIRPAPWASSPDARR